MAELSQVLSQVLVLAEGFGIAMPPARQTIYAECLADLPLERLRQGVVHLLKSRTFAGNLPSIAEIREAAGGNVNDRNIVSRDGSRIMGVSPHPRAEILVQVAAET